MIRFYGLNGCYDHEEELNRANLEHIHGMKVKLILISGKSVIGYCSSAVILTGDYIEICCSFDMEKGFSDKRFVFWADIKNVEAFLYSNPRWGTSVNFAFDIPEAERMKH